MKNTLVWIATQITTTAILVNLLFVATFIYLAYYQPENLNAIVSSITENLHPVVDEFNPGLVPDKF